MFPNLTPVKTSETTVDVFRVAQGADFYIPRRDEKDVIGVNRDQRHVKISDEAAHLFMGDDTLPCLVMITDHMTVVVEESDIWKR